MRGQADSRVHMEAAGSRRQSDEEGAEVPRSRRFGPFLITVALTLAGLALGWWAARATLPPQAEVVSSDQTLTYTVREVSVGRSLNLAVTAEREQTLMARNGAAGVVTAAEPGIRTVEAGTVLYSVNERPVVAVAGTVPFYRDLAVGARGRDVAQLHEFLRAADVAEVPSGAQFTAATERAVVAWQKQVGVEPTGVVMRADLVALPRLPADVVLLESITVGAEVAGGEDAVAAVDPQPQFTLILGPEQKDLVPLDADVVVVVDGQDHRAVMGTPTEAPDGDLRIPLHGPNGSSVCADTACAAAVPAGAPTSLPARVVVTPDTTGPGVPVGALTSGPDGQVTATLSTGTVVEVSVLASSDGVAVVDGLDIGDDVVLRTAQDLSPRPTASGGSS